MKDEEVVDCVIEIDEMLAEIERALRANDGVKALKKVKEARETIEEFREDDESMIDRQEVEMDVMNKIK